MIHNRFVPFMLAMLVLLLVGFSAQAQDDAAYRIALRRIEIVANNNSILLDLSDIMHGLAELPPEIWQLTNLQILHLRQNHLTSLPSEIGQLTNLRELYLSYNALTSLPPEIGQLSNLQILDLSYNALMSLPPEIGQLSNLQILDLRNNALMSLPSEMRQLTHLQRLSVNGNTLLHMPDDVRSSDIHTQIDYLVNAPIRLTKKALILLVIGLVIGGLWYKFERIRPYLIFILTGGLSSLCVFSTGLVAALSFWFSIYLGVGIAIGVGLIIGAVCTAVYRFYRWE